MVIPVCGFDAPELKLKELDAVTEKSETITEMITECDKVPLVPVTVTV
jgi:hypothetical protein